ncbi:ABC transporter ATP-binding protein [Rummeliibacillus sp. TYF005]|uniref:ABC transporter ATP-binding protein n=1 Tax=unclassified Rummeliibacillus TaxID=2622809 RepID=UPI000E66D4E5|nr:MULTISPECIES: ABC transporter ATP-binding protein [unclassified Rummeliibacillus]RIJ66438.1 ABC transporter ATP-binding protein [Rummeliibacillus sp. POC4]RPJ94496.1 ABC transporter ATP-binding protein [Rummeliibacillus sp. TYF005]
MTLKLKNISYSYSNKDKQKNQVISKLNMEIKKGEFISIVGRSGTGKSTILRLMTGLLQPDEGEIRIDDLEISLGDVGYMPQKDLLLPWRTILDNILIASEIQKDLHISKDEARIWLQRVGLSEYEHALPKQLSGGMRQRVAFLRALLTGKDVLLLDEPFGALDALTKKEMQSWLLSIWQDLNKTIVFITHDLEEAIFVSDRILLLHPDQRIEEILIPLPRPRKSEMLFSEEIVTLRQELEKKIANESTQKFSTNL